MRDHLSPTTIAKQLGRHKSTIALATSTAMIGSASATTISWGEFDLTAAAGEISTKGTLVEAFNLVTNNARVGTDTTTINGVTFRATNLFTQNEDRTYGVSTGDASLDLLYLQAGHNGAGKSDNIDRSN